MSTASSSRGRFVETPFCIRSLCLICKRVFGTCALGLLRKEHLLSPLTSRVVCLPLHVPDVEHLGSIFQPHFEVGGGSRHTFSSQRSVCIVSDALLIFLHILVASWTAFAAFCTAGDCSPFSRSATCLMRALQPASVMAMLLSRLRVAFNS